MTAHPQRGNVLLDPDVTEQIKALGIDASMALDRPVVLSDCSSVRPAKQVLGQVWDLAVAAMNQPGTGFVPGRLAELTGLLARVRELETQVDDARVAESVEIMRRIRRALSALHDAATVDELLSRAAEQACTIGFDRALVSTVDGGTWNLHTMFIEKDPELAREMVAVGRRNPPMLDGSLIESEIVERGRPRLVFDVQKNSRVNRQLVTMSGCTSYGVAPINSRGKVVGLVHADNFYYDPRNVDATDRAVLNLYAEGLGQALAQVSVVEGLNSLRAGMARLLDGGLPQPAPAAASASDPRGALLSAREAEVIELMSCGDANRAIARKLSISEGTVKTHITHILRKLDASNRAEAVAYWLKR
jgi:DNA-binding CsgD family transcriptional regulator